MKYIAAEAMVWKDSFFLRVLACSVEYLHVLHHCLRPSGERLSRVNSEMGKWCLHLEQYLAVRGV
jgi:hypothetical protein